MKLYNVPFFSSARDFLLHLALNRGKLKKVSFTLFANDDTIYD